MHGYPMLLVHHFFDNDGNNAAGYLLYTYEAGTSTLKATFQDAGLSVENTNPIIMDEFGRCTIFVCGGEGYKLAFWSPDGQLIWTRDNWSVPGVEDPAPPAEVPIGGIMMYAGVVAPAGWFFCDGNVLSRTEWPDLFAEIGTTYGVGDGSTTYTLPNLTGRFPLGVAASGTGSTLGATGGAIDHVHAGPSHTHPIAGHTHTIAHTHSVPRDGWGSNFVVTPVAGRLGADDGTGINVMQAANDNVTGATSVANSGSTSLVTDAAGTGNTGPSNPPFLAINFIIRAYPVPV